ncbi:hypothetical protein CIW49_18615 [Mycolicibacterium sp. P1-18]|uniref:hypothetical protein n=1 Tax=Mycolicibacterium sp. P1-18 TaxID=2024615 RepID=UPI0011F24DA3|nr:hypothetical protein [Mycolicibacterium sp. P1-18]KAA0096685.1 hypothetical protein CIW49_18615 [Mycolicibacterium sp. P1-18]
MQIQGDKLDSIEQELVQLTGVQPPRAVLTALLALVDPDDHVASWADWHPNPNTDWRVWFVTDASLAFLHLEFAEMGWHRGEEESQYGREQFVASETHAAWVRPLDTVTEIQVIGYGNPLGDHRQELPLHGLVLKFADGGTAQLPTQEAMYPQHRAGIDRLIEAIRERVAFWG